MTRVLFCFLSPSLNAQTRGYLETQEALDRVRPDHRVLFLGSPFRDMPHPLVRAQNEQIERRRIMRKLAEHWNELAIARDNLLKPAFKKNHQVILDGCGFDAAFSLWQMSPAKLREEIVFAHFDYVHNHQQTKGVPAPVYIIVRDSNQIEYAAFRELEADSDVSYEEYFQYLENFDTFVDLYFGHLSQNPPYIVQRVSSGEAIADQVITFLHEQPMEMAA